MLKPTKKARVVKEHAAHKSDTGSANVQIALLTEEIKKLSTHLKKHSKDDHSRRGLLKMVAKRKKLLNYLQKEDEASYNKLIRKLKLKK